MEEKKALALQIATLEKQLEKKRRNWFLGIWLGYSAVIFMFGQATRDMDNILDFIFTDTLAFIELLLLSLIIGVVFWFINACIWTAACNSIRYTTDLMKDFEKRYSEMP